jgi:predicted dehydrogenase
VSWSDADGTTGSLEGEALTEKTSPLAVTHANPDGAFVRNATENEPGFPDFSVALEAHRIVEAMYRSARDSGNSVTVASVQ